MRGARCGGSEKRPRQAPRDAKISNFHATKQHCCRSVIANIVTTLLVNDVLLASSAFVPQVAFSFPLSPSTPRIPPACVAVPLRCMLRTRNPQEHAMGSGVAVPHQHFCICLPSPRPRASAFSAPEHAHTHAHTPCRTPSSMTSSASRPTRARTSFARYPQTGTKRPRRAPKQPASPSPSLCPGVAPAARPCVLPPSL